MRKIIGSADRFIGFTFNFFHLTSGAPVVARWIWRQETPLTSIKAVWTSLEDFGGHEFHVGTLPWSHHVLGDKEAAPPDAPATYTNYWGYEVDLLNSVANKLNFTYTVSNVADGKWGHIEADATWSGMVAQAAFGDVDFVICDMFLTYIRVKMFDPTISFDKDYMVFVAPNPGQYPKYLALIRPFDSLVWILVFSSLIVLSVVYLVISKSEEKVNLLPFSLITPAGCRRGSKGLVLHGQVPLVRVRHPDRREHDEGHQGEGGGGRLVRRCWGHEGHHRRLDALLPPHHLRLHRQPQGFPDQPRPDRPH